MEGIPIFILIFTDIIGDLKQIEITSDEISEILMDGQGFDGSSIRGFVRIEESDLMLHPRLNSFRILPPMLSNNGKKTGIFFCDIRTPDGKPFPGDPRQCLKRMLRKTKRRGFTFYVGPEPEFFYFKNSTDFTPLDKEGYIEAGGHSQGTILRAKTIEILRKMEIQIECAHHEVAPSQHEIDLKYKEALTMADQLMLFKWIVKKMAEVNGLYATFLPKPIFGENGSGMHVHMSLFRGNRNAFYDGRNKYNLSLIAWQFVAGMLNHVTDFTVITNPIVNSYKRLVPGYEAPCYVSWGRRNRSSLVRIPDYRRGKAIATRAELRSPDPVCNPYLAFSVMLAAGMDGIDEKFRLNHPVEDNIFNMSDRARNRMNIRMLPGSLQEAIVLGETSRFLIRALGPHIHHAYLDNKKKEWEDYRTHVSPWELEHQGLRY